MKIEGFAYTILIAVVLIGVVFLIANRFDFSSRCEQAGGQALGMKSGVVCLKDGKIAERWGWTW